MPMVTADSTPVPAAGVRLPVSHPAMVRATVTGRVIQAANRGTLMELSPHLLTLRVRDRDRTARVMLGETGRGRGDDLTITHK
jgi:hypothetical protein